MQKRPDILYLITKSNFFGAQKYVYELAVEAQANGYDVAVACGGTGAKAAPTGELVTKLEAAHIPVYPIKNFMRDMSTLQDIKAGFEVLRLLLKLRPRVLHTTSSKAGAVGAFTGRLAGIRRIIFTSHGLTMDETWRPKWQQLLITWATWFTMLLSHHSILISTETFKRVQKLPFLASRVSLIFNGIHDIASSEQSVARATLAPAVPAGATWIGGVGELHPNKNWSSLIATLPHLPTNVHVCIIGAGEEKTQLLEQAKSLAISDRVHLLGYQPAAENMKAFDIFVLPSKKEGLPYVLLEAGLAGRPTIATNLPGNYDIINHAETGLLVPPHTNDLLTALQDLLDDPAKAERFGTALRHTVKENFSLPSMIQKTFALYLLK